MPTFIQIGVISDTHGRLHPSIPYLFRDVAYILHAGDIGNANIIHALEQIAPVYAVTGNVDWGTRLEEEFPRTLSLSIGGVDIYMTHIGGQPRTWFYGLPLPHPRVVIFGHTHEPLLEEHQGILFLNPGTAGQPRYGGGLSVARLTIEKGQPSAEIIVLDEGGMVDAL